MNTTRSFENSSKMTFTQLVEKWKPFHYLKLEMGTQQTYERRLPHFDYLKDFLVEDISISTIDDLVSHWVKNCVKSKRRFTFEKKLQIPLTLLKSTHQKMLQTLGLRFFKTWATSRQNSCDLKLEKVTNTNRRKNRTHGKYKWRR